VFEIGARNGVRHLSLICFLSFEKREKNKMEEGRPINCSFSSEQVSGENSVTSVQIIIEHVDTTWTSFVKRLQCLRAIQSLLSACFFHIFLTSALVGGEWSASLPCRFTPGERAPCTHWIGSWVGPRAGLDYVEKRKFLTLPELELRPLSHPVRSQSLLPTTLHGRDRKCKHNFIQ
jgi:hypothetical protein